MHNKAYATGCKETTEAATLSGFSSVLRFLKYFVNKMMFQI